MKYINPYYSLFSGGVMSISGPEKGYIKASDAECRIDLGTVTGGKLYIAYDIYMFNDVYNSKYYMMVRKGTSTLFQNWTQPYNGQITIESGGNSTLYKMTIARKRWYRIYQVYDYVNGTLECYIDGILETTVTSNIGKGVPDSVSFNIPYTGTDGIAIRNIIISDVEFPMTETVKELTLEVKSSDWTESDGVYATDETGKVITLGVAEKDIDGYNIKSVQFGAFGALASEAIGHVEVDINGNKEELLLPTTAGGISSKAVEMNNIGDLAIKITSKE